MRCIMWWRSGEPHPHWATSSPLDAEEEGIVGRSRPVRSGSQAPSETAKGMNEAIALLRSWRDGDEQEQRETWEYLQKVLDEDRPGQRKLFPRPNGGRG
jgi:hypothetical protein